MRKWVGIFGSTKNGVRPPHHHSMCAPLVYSQPFGEEEFDDGLLYASLYNSVEMCSTQQCLH